MDTEQSQSLDLPEPNVLREHVQSALRDYWSEDQKLVEKLPIPICPNPAIQLPLQLTTIRLPSWANECGVDSQLLIPRELVQEGNDWQNVDWWLAAFLLLEGWHERLWEAQHSPIHSYSFRLKGWDVRAWEHAWVNRIGLFLRAWAIQQSEDGDTGKLGPLPNTKIHMTHDVDAVAKTLPIRLKQGAFNLFNAVQSVRRGQFRQTAERLRQANRFLFGQEDWWTFDRLQEWESDSGIPATYHFHADPQSKTLKRWLFDPGYDIASPKLKTLLRQLASQGHTIGLHPGFETWQDTEQITAQRDCVEQAAGVQVSSCRQHWLRFSWEKTWMAQAQSGLSCDRTLMFNDRFGFRNSSALLWNPWNPVTSSYHLVSVEPTILMDSHLYDYQSLDPFQQRKAIGTLMHECQIVHGKAAILWHPHTLTKDYGWIDGFCNVLEEYKRIS